MGSHRESIQLQSCSLIIPQKSSLCSKTRAVTTETNRSYPLPWPQAQDLDSFPTLLKFPMVPGCSRVREPSLPWPIHRPWDVKPSLAFPCLEILLYSPAQKQQGVRTIKLPMFSLQSNHDLWLAELGPTDFYIFAQCILNPLIF